MGDERAERIAEFVRPLRVEPGSEPGSKVRLELLQCGVELLADHQRRLAAEVLAVRVHPENLERQKLSGAVRGPDVWGCSWSSARPGAGAGQDPGQAQRLTPTPYNTGNAGNAGNVER
ncbi:hypothetical protein [Streptomyces sp. T028]|uniref:hypothetical protein n=1 Tax=Streptomyces sp. T028 TaxID=3394379 RepID=UPI003A8C3B1C